MYIVFYSTNNVFKAEELLQKANVDCSIVPTPVQDKAYCGVCVKTSASNCTELLSELEHIVIEEA